jgi:hypothetical protein
MMIFIMFSNSSRYVEVYQNGVVAHLQSKVSMQHMLISLPKQSISFTLKISILLDQQR